MRRMTWLIVAASWVPVVAAEKPLDELERVRIAAAEARKAAAADPTIHDAGSPPVKAYLAEQRRRRLLRLTGLRQRLGECQGDPSRQDLVPILKQQLAELESKPPEQVSFDSAYGYPPTTGLVGYSKKVRLLENHRDGKSVILVDNAALVLEGLGTSQYASGKFFGIEKAILIGVPGTGLHIPGNGEEVLRGNAGRPGVAVAVLSSKKALKRARGKPTEENPMGTFIISALLSLVIAPTPGCEPAAADPTAVPMANRPRVPGVLRLHLRERREEPAGSGTIKIVERTVDWNVAETAIIVCDMWDDHRCKIAAQRVGVLAPRMNQVLTAARDRGVMIIHAPSETMNVYAGTPYRMRMERAKPATPPVPIERRCDVDPTREPQPLPVDRTLDCDDATPGPEGPQHTRQNAAIDIIGFDGISDDGREIYNFCEQEGIKNVVLMGVHTNYCVLGRSFGIRQMVRLGRSVVLARDLTDALYDPRQPPYVSHARGTEMVVEHVERYWCPSILGDDLTRVVPGSDGPIAATTARPGEH